MKSLAEIRNSEEYRNKMSAIKPETGCRFVSWDRVLEIAEDYAYRCWKSGEDLSVEKLTRALVYYDYNVNLAL